MVIILIQRKIWAVLKLAGIPTHYLNPDKRTFGVMDLYPSYPDVFTGIFRR